MGGAVLFWLPSPRDHGRARGGPRDLLRHALPLPVAASPLGLPALAHRVSLVRRLARCCLFERVIACEASAISHAELHPCWSAKPSVYGALVEDRRAEIVAGDQCRVGADALCSVASVKAAGMN